MTRARALVLAPLVGLLLYVLWPAGDPAAPALDGGDPSLLTDRPWLEALPTSPTQHIHVLFALADAPLGVFQRGSAYQANLEVFEFSRDGGRLDLRFPQTDQEASLRFQARACSDHPPFDLCLELDRNPWGGPTRYFGFSDERAAPAVVRELGHRLGHAAIDGP